MTRPVRLGAVDYLNVRPLVHGLDRHPDRVTLRFDVPAVCATLLDAGEIDLGMVPSIAHLDRPGDLIVPGVCIGSDGPVASVALFHRRPLREVRSIALDSSSRTSVALTKILCARRFDVTPTFVTRAPDLESMLATADAALLIGDPALFVDALSVGAVKTDLGAEWTAMTGFPFVWAFWAGRPAAAPRDIVSLLRAAAAQGMQDTDRIAQEFLAGDAERQKTGCRYLRENLRFELDARALEGLRTFYAEAARLGLAPGDVSIAFFDA